MECISPHLDACDHEKEKNTECIAHLAELKSKIGKATAALSVPLGELVGMHNARLKKRTTVEGKPAKRPKNTTDPA